MVLETVSVALQLIERLPSATNIVLALVDVEVDDVTQLLLDVDFVRKSETSKPSSDANDAKFPW